MCMAMNVIGKTGERSLRDFLNFANLWINIIHRRLRMKDYEIDIKEIKDILKKMQECVKRIERNL